MTEDARPMREGVLIETDLLVGFLRGTDEALGKILERVPVYTTVVQATEVLGRVSQGDVEKAMALLGALRVLGFSARYATAMGEALRASGAGEKGLRNAMVAGCAREARLPVVTRENVDTLRAMGATVVSPEECYAVTERE